TLFRSRANSIAAPCQFLPTPGPTGVRPRVGFNPTSPLNEAGIRMEPPPSLAPAIGTTPDATSAAAPPLEPPGAKFLFQAFLVGPHNFDSVIFFNANSGVVEFPIDTIPDCKNFSVKLLVTGAIASFINRYPPVVGSRSIVCDISFNAVGTPFNGPSVFSISSYAFSLRV